MDTLLFITSKPDKVRVLQGYLQKVGVACQVSLCEEDIPEPQGRSIIDIAEKKALLAYRQLRQPVVVEDSGFYIDALNGFPGPYVKYALDTLGIEGITKLMADKEERGCRFVSAVSLVDVNGKLHTFIDESSAIGSVADVPAETKQEQQSIVSRLFIPEGFDKPIAAMTPTEINAYWAQKGSFSAMSQLAEALPNIALNREKDKTDDVLAR